MSSTFHWRRCTSSLRPVRIHVCLQMICQLSFLRFGFYRLAFAVCPLHILFYHVLPFFNIFLNSQMYNLRLSLLPPSVLRYIPERPYPLCLNVPYCVFFYTLRILYVQFLRYESVLYVRIYNSCKFT